MARMKKNKVDEKLLTETELELIQILWKLEEGSVNDVLEMLPKERDLAYTSVSTILRILEQKKILKSRKEGRGHIYQPLISKNEYEEKTVKYMVGKVFDGAPMALAKQLLQSETLTATDLKELKELIKNAEKGQE